jgi:hypothetical protein
VSAGSLLFVGSLLSVGSSFLLAGCSGDAFESGTGGSDGAGGDGNAGPGDPSGGPGPTSGRDDVEPRLDVARSTRLGELEAGQRVVLCADLLRVFNTDVDNDRYRELQCTAVAYEASAGDESECADRFDACREQLPRPVLSDRVEDSFGCDAARQRFVTPAGPVTLDNACATVGQALDCWQAFGVAYERGFLDAVSGSPRSCAQAQSNTPDLSAQVGFGIPSDCDDLVSDATGCP